MPMPSPTQSKRTSSREKTLRLALAGLMGALLVVGKQVMSGLPNIEPVTLLIVLFTLELPRETPAAITVFLLLQGVLYGFGLWWAMYIYVWYLLALLTWLLRRMDNALGWAVFSGIYGLCFGDQRPALRCHARCGQFCADAAGLPPLAPCAADRKTADRPVNKEKRCPRLLPGAAFFMPGGVSQGKALQQDPQHSRQVHDGGQQLGNKEKQGLKHNLGLLSYYKRGDITGSALFVAAGTARSALYTSEPGKLLQNFECEKTWVDGSSPQKLFDPQQLVVFGHPFAAAGGAGLDLTGVQPYRHIRTAGPAAPHPWCGRPCRSGWA